MAYSTSAQVADEFQGVSFGATTVPTDTTVDRWIAEADQVIDAHVGLRYEVPVVEGDSPLSFLIVRKISIMLVASRVRKILNRSGANGDTARKVITDDHDKAMKMLKQISDGKMELSDVDPRNAKLGVSSYNVDAGEEFTFKKNIDQW